MIFKDIDFILQNLSNAERDEFLKEILENVLSGKDIKDIILGWEATAEINSCPSTKRKILGRSKKLHHFSLAR